MSSVPRSDAPVPTLPIDLVMDTNAVRGLGRLASDEWEKVAAHFERSAIGCAWIPTVITEATATNLIRHSLTSDDLAELVLAVQRYDTLCKRLILPSPDRLMWSAIHRFAGVDEPPFPGKDLTRDHRQWLERFVQVTRPEQVRVHDGDMRTVFIKLDTDQREWGAPIRAGFVRASQLGIEWLHQRLTESPSITRKELAWEYFRRWLPHVTVQLGVSEEVVRRIDEDRDPHQLANSPFFGGLVEGWFIAGRAMQEGSKTSENDARDIAISSYLSVAATLVTSDRRFAGTVRGLLTRPSRIASFEELLDGVGAGEDQGPN